MPVKEFPGMRFRLFYERGCPKTIRGPPKRLSFSFYIKKEKKKNHFEKCAIIPIKLLVIVRTGLLLIFFFLSLNICNKKKKQKKPHVIIIKFITVILHPLWINN